MTYLIEKTETTGQSLFGYLMQHTPGVGATAPTFPMMWDHANDAWDLVANISAGDQLITLVETSGKEFLGQYRGSTNTDLGTYTGFIRAFVTDGVSHIADAKEDYVVNGQQRFTDSLSLVDVPRQYRWIAGNDSSKASNTITVNAADSITLSMDFANVLAEDDTIQSLLSCADQSANGLVPTNLKTYANRKRVNVDVSGLTSGLTYTLRHKVLTAYAVTKSIDGVLKVG